MKCFIEDYIKYFKDFKINLDIDFIDWLYGYCMSGGIGFFRRCEKSFITIMR